MNSVVYALDQAVRVDRISQEHAIGVGVGVDEAGRDGHTGRVDLALGRQAG